MGAPGLVVGAVGDDPAATGHPRHTGMVCRAVRSAGTAWEFGWSAGTTSAAAANASSRSTASAVANDSGVLVDLDASQVSLPNFSRPHRGLRENHAAVEIGCYERHGHSVFSLISPTHGTPVRALLRQGRRAGWQPAAGCGRIPGRSGVDEDLPRHPPQQDPRGFSTLGLTS